jgi:pyridoxal phosphate enzyme (YggS family)
LATKRAPEMLTARAKIWAMTLGSDDMSANLAQIRERMERAASRAGRRAEEITLIGVSKTHSATQIREMYDAGVRHFGENRVQEWESKHASLKDLDATWHMIGHLQSNKVARAVQLFHTIDSVDTLALADRLERARKDFNTEGTESTERRGESDKGLREERLRVLIEVRLDPNPAKSGVSDNDLPRLVEAVLHLPHMELRGLMGVPPYFDDPQKSRPYFRRLHELRDAMRKQMGRELLPVLSMGMSQDFEVAIEEGATEIRIGTALFGERRRA